jgi:hypothetical protein
VSTPEGIQVTTATTMDNGGQATTLVQGPQQFKVALSMILLPGRYTVGVGIFHSNGANMDWVQRAYDFEVRKIAQDDYDSYRWNKVRGFIRPDACWTLPSQMGSTSLSHCTLDQS